MAAESMEVARQIYAVLEAEGLNAGALDILVERGLVDPNGEIYLRTVDPAGNAALRLDELEPVLTAPPWGALTLEVQSFRAIGEDRVLISLRYSAGNRAGVRGGHMLTVRDGRAVRLESFVGRPGGARHSAPDE